MTPLPVRCHCPSTHSSQHQKCVFWCRHEAPVSTTRTSTDAHPRTSANAHPRASANAHPRTSANAHPRASANAHPRTSANAHPRATARPQPHTHTASHHASRRGVRGQALHGPAEYFADGSLLHGKLDSQNQACPSGWQGSRFILSREEGVEEAD